MGMYTSFNFKLHMNRSQELMDLLPTLPLFEEISGWGRGKADYDWEGNELIFGDRHGIKNYAQEIEKTITPLGKYLFTAYPRFDVIVGFTWYEGYDYPKYWYEDELENAYP